MAWGIRGVVIAFVLIRFGRWLQGRRGDGELFAVGVVAFALAGGAAVVLVVVLTNDYPLATVAMLVAGSVVAISALGLALWGRHRELVEARELEPPPATDDTPLVH